MGPRIDPRGCAGQHAPNKNRSVVMLKRLSTVAAAFAAGMSLVTHAQDVVVFDDVNVVPMDEERVLEARTVIVRDGRIESIGESGEAEIPADASVADAGRPDPRPGVA